MIYIGNLKFFEGNLNVVLSNARELIQLKTWYINTEIWIFKCFEII